MGQFQESQILMCLLGLIRRVLNMEVSGPVLRILITEVHDSASRIINMVVLGLLSGDLKFEVTGPL